MIANRGLIKFEEWDCKETKSIIIGKEGTKFQIIYDRINGTIHSRKVKTITKKYSMITKWEKQEGKVTGIEILSIENAWNLKDKTIEECFEFTEALIEYEKYEELLKNKKLEIVKNDWVKIKKQKLLENVLNEIADCEVMRKQHVFNCTNFKLNDIIEEEKYLKYEKMLEENKEYISKTINWKIARTLLRNKVNYYKQEE